MTIIYSTTINLFLARQRQYLNDILLRYHNSGFTGLRQVDLFVFDKKGTNGMFVLDGPRGRPTIFLCRSLVVSEESVVQNIIKHEFAHYLNCLRGGIGHDQQFREICAELGVEEGFELSTSDVTPDPESIVGKIRKLLALGTSSNEAEAEAAIAKANQLLAKHNLTLNDGLPVEEIHYAVVHRSRRKDALARAIGVIIKSFGLTVIHNYNGKNGEVCIEASGTKADVEVAEYAAEYIRNELPRLFRESGLKGVSARNSFYIGLATGFSNKMERSVKEAMTTEETTALTVYRGKMDKKAREVVYPSARFRKTTGAVSNSDAYGSGKEAGKKFSIKPAVRGSGVGLIGR